MDESAGFDAGIYPRSVRESLQKAVPFQQNLYELSSDWNFYDEDQHVYLKKNMRYALFGPDGIARCDSTDRQRWAEEEARIDEVYRKILEASRSKKSLYVGIIFNVLCNIDEGEEFVCPVPIFTVKRCVEKGERSDAGRSDAVHPTRRNKIGNTALHPCCVHYVDLEGRIYKNWTDYVTNNTLPKCLMVLPTGGFYQANPYADNTAEETFVWVEVGPSPAAARRVVSHLDKASTVLGLGAMGIGAAALAAPALLGASVVAAGSVCAAVAGAYTTVRSGQQLLDRHEHRQSIDVKDSSARSAWFGVVGGVASGLASGSTFVLSKAARAGLTLGAVTRSAHNAIAIGSIVVNGAGIGNGVFGMVQNYKERGEVSYAEVGQVMAHILFFGNAVMNFQTATTVISNAQQRVLRDYENSLRSNRHRKAFKKIRQNTRASCTDSIAGDSEIIRGIRSIENKDDFFAGIVRNRKLFSRADAQVTFKDGYATINDNMRFDPIELSQQPKRIRIHTLRAAEPINRPESFGSFSSPKKMTVSTYNEQVNSTRELIESLPSLQQISVVCYVAKSVGNLVLEFQEFREHHRDGIIAGLAKIALRIIQENRHNVTKAIDALMYYVWKTHVQPKVDEQLTFLGLNIDRMSENPAMSELVYTVIQGIINWIYDGIEDFLQEIIEGCAGSPLTYRLASCDVCSGYALSDKE